MIRFLPAALGAVVVCSFIAGCTAAPEGTSAASRPSPSSSLSAPKPVATKPALSDLVISPEGLGSIQIGLPVPVESDAVAIVKYDPEYCKDSTDLAGDTFTPGAPFAGAWVTTYSDPDAFELFPAGGVESAPITEISASAWNSGTTSPIHTATGIHPGSSTAELKAAYPTFDGVRSYPNQSDVYTIIGKAGVLIFETTPTTDSSGYYAAADLNRVVEIRVLDKASPESERLAPHSMTDGYGHCA